MSNDFTQRQSVGEQMRAEELSRRATVPPSEVPGYRLERMLGQGAFGQVWVGKNLNTGRTVAIKFYLHRGGVDWSLLAREVKHLVSMSANRFIVQVLEVGWDSEPPYYVMEYLENGSLDDLIRSRGCLPISLAVDLFTDIAAGLNHSHGKGVLHCDLKPANVLLDQDMRPRLADFGQSRMSHEQTPSLGTLFYMAPEQADLEAAPDARWDVYALGAILYCMVVGTPPYRTPQMVSTLDTAASLPDRLKRYRETIQRAPAPKQHYRVRGMDRALGSIIDRCLGKRPADRFQNVEQVLEALHRRSQARVQRPLLLLGIVGPLLLLAVMGIFSWRGIQTAEHESSQQLQDWALRSNEFAAKFAARTLETELNSLFRLIEAEARSPMLHELYEAARTSIGIETLDRLAAEQADPTIREEMLKNPKRLALRDYLMERLRNYQPDTDDDHSVQFSSLFLTDEHGTQFAIAILEKADNVVGRNFAFRSYFTGMREDLPGTKDRKSISPLSMTHISAPFQSTSTGNWKIAVATPIVLDASQETIGVLALTVNLGNFDLLGDQSADANTGHRRFSVLVDGHEGAREGTLVQHPALARKGSKEKYQINSEQLNELKKRGLLTYRDPVGESAGGEEFRGDWIAAMQRVDVTQQASQGPNAKRAATDLWVLVQERAENVTNPVQSLGTKLFREGMTGLLTVVAVTALLWFVVLYVIRLPDNAFRSVKSSPTGGETPSRDETTLSAR